MSTTNLLLLLLFTPLWTSSDINFVQGLSRRRVDLFWGCTRHKLIKTTSSSATFLERENQKTSKICQCYGIDLDRWAKTGCLTRRLTIVDNEWSEKDYYSTKKVTVEKAKRVSWVLNPKGCYSIRWHSYCTKPVADDQWSVCVCTIRIAQHWNYWRITLWLATLQPRELECRENSNATSYKRKA